MDVVGLIDLVLVALFAAVVIWCIVRRGRRSADMGKQSEDDLGW